MRKTRSRSDGLVRPAWPWDDRGRSQIPREQIQIEARNASFAYGRAMSGEKQLCKDSK
jgi:hypothetical protein